MKSVLIITCLAALSQAISYPDHIQDEWNLYKIRYKKEYKNETEEYFRMKIFVENKGKILKHNKRYEKGLVSFKMKVNQFADLLNHEFNAMMNGLNRSLTSPNAKRPKPSTFIQPDNVLIPKTIDWRTKGAVTPVKNQGRCLSCWAFSTTGSLEAQNFRKSGKLVSLSEQNLVDCSGDYGNNGCDGGMVDFAFEYIKANEGIDTEKSYPYEAEDDTCRYDPKNKGATETGFVDIPEGSEEKLEAAVGTVGPISVGIDANHESFQYYAEGVYYEPNCNPKELTHAVLVVGYGESERGEEYWIVKNSWGTQWGDDGYILMRKNRNNNCGIATSASYPLV